MNRVNTRVIRRYGCSRSTGETCNRMRQMKQGSSYSRLSVPATPAASLTSTEATAVLVAMLAAASTEPDRDLQARCEP